MGQALYRKYRSRSLKEIVGQEHITETLRHAIDTGRISHAYLFTGPRGVGKTSIARILAHELNNVPYSDEGSHLDIIEIDAASNGGVEEVRDLRDKVHIAPSSGRFKVYIIDEVHMMTASAFNALLKTLEEPPAHAIFILATTEAHKLPATIISRTQRFTFKPVPKGQVAAHLRHIAGEEHIDISDSALELIAEHSEGSFRDSISMLDQAGSMGRTIERADIESLLGIPAAESVDNLLSLLAAGNALQLTLELAILRENGYQASAVAKLLSSRLRERLLDGSAALPSRQVLELLTRLIDVPASRQPDQLLELVLLESALIGTDNGQASQPAAVTSVPPKEPLPIERKPVRPVSPPPTVTNTDDLSVSAPPVAQLVAAPVDAAPDAHPADMLDDTQWQLVLAALRKQYNTLYGIIRMARPEYTPGKIHLTFGFAFHQKRANDTKNKQLLMAVIENVTGQRIAVECLFDRSVTPPAPAPLTAVSAQPTVTAVPLEAISTIFGGGEVLNQ